MVAAQASRNPDTWIGVANNPKTIPYRGFPCESLIGYSKLDTFGHRIIGIMRTI